MLAVKSNESDLMFSEYRLPNDQMSKKKKSLNSHCLRVSSDHVQLTLTSCIVSIYIYGEFDMSDLSTHEREVNKTRKGRTKKKKKKKCVALPSVVLFTENSIQSRK